MIWVETQQANTVDICSLLWITVGTCPQEMTSSKLIFTMLYKLNKHNHIHTVCTDGFLSLSLGEKVPSSKTYFWNGVASLSLSQCSPVNAGTYTCTAENTAGKQSSSAVLYVKGELLITGVK